MAVPYGSIISTAGKIGKYLWAIRKEEKETGKVVRKALRSSICPYDPYAPNVDELAERIEGEMWRLAESRGEGRIRKFVDGVKRRLPFRRRGPEALDFPHWRDELKR